MNPTPAKPAKQAMTAPPLKTVNPMRNLGMVFLVGLLIFAIYQATAVQVHWLGQVSSMLPGDAETEKSARDLLKALVIVAGFVVNYFLLRRFTQRWQIWMVWVELLLVLALFFSTFNLSFTFIESKIGYLLKQGAVTTLYISAVSIVLAFAFALVGAIAKLSDNGIAMGIASFYTSLFRGLPLLMQIFILYIGLPQLGYIVNPIPAGIAALSLCYGAYMTEIFRAGIESIPKGQWEAAYALGLRGGKIMRLVILPQALKIIIPPTGNQFIAMLKDSSLVSVVGVWELTYVARTAGQREFKHIEMLITAALIYWAMSIVLELVQARIERRFKSTTR